MDYKLQYCDINIPSSSFLGATPSTETIYDPYHAVIRDLSRSSVGHARCKLVGEMEALLPLPFLSTAHQKKIPPKGGQTWRNKLSDART